MGLVPSAAPCEGNDAAVTQASNAHAVALKRSLCDSDKAKVVKATGLLDHASNQEVVVEIPIGAGNSNIQLLGKHFARLAPGKWLQDETVNAMVALIALHDNANRAHDLTRSLFFNSFFIDKLIDEGDYTKMQKQVEKAREKLRMTGKVIPALENIFLPVVHYLSRELRGTYIRDAAGEIVKDASTGETECHTGDPYHWSLIQINFPRATVGHYDSSDRNNGGVGQFTSAILDFLKKTFVRQHGDQDWHVVRASDSSPQQTNGHDCGVFTCMTAAFLSLGLGLDFSQDDMPHFRQLIALSLLNKEFLK